MRRPSDWNRAPESEGGVGGSTMVNARAGLYCINRFRELLLCHFCSGQSAVELNNE